MPVIDNWLTMFISNNHITGGDIGRSKGRDKKGTGSGDSYKSFAG